MQCSAKVRVSSVNITLKQNYYKLYEKFHFSPSPMEFGPPIRAWALKPVDLLEFK